MINTAPLVTMMTMMGRAAEENSRTRRTQHTTQAKRDEKLHLTALEWVFLILSCIILLADMVAFIVCVILNVLIVL